MKRYVLILLVAVLAFSCAPKHWVLTNGKTSKIAIDARTESLADKDMKAFIAPIKQNLDKEMNVVIAHSAVEMKSGKPESLLSNWNSDVYRITASEFLKEPVDVAVVNMGSLRASLPKGDITIRNIFELMPFENELVILWLKGSSLNDLLQIFAKEFGQGVSGIKMEIQDGKAVNISINNKPLEKNKLYSIATNDYLAAGNDRMLPLAKPEKRLDTNLKIRNVLMEYVIRENLHGKMLNAKLDDRIKIIQ